MKLKCNRWCLQIFNNKPKIISVYFAHIIEQMPEGEYQHWMAYNICPSPVDKGITQKEFYTSGCGMPHFPERNDHKFKSSLKHYYRQCINKNKTPILKELNWVDQPYFNTLNLISEDSQWHFDLQILCLAKILIESINIDELENRGIKKQDHEGNKIKSKNMLKEYLNQCTKQNNSFDYQKFLDNLYKIRLGSAHRRPNKCLQSDYWKGLSYFNKKSTTSLENTLDDIFTGAYQLINLITTAEGLKLYDELSKNTYKTSL